MTNRRLTILLGLCVLLFAAACDPPTSSPPPSTAWCDVDVRFDDADVAHVHGETNLPAGTMFHVELHGNGRPMQSGDFTTTRSGAADGTEAVPNWGYPVAWTVDAYVGGRLLCADPWTTQGARYITNVDWWASCTADTDPVCAHDVALQTNPT